MWSLVVVNIDKLRDCHPRLIDRLVLLQPKTFAIKSSEPPLDHSISFRRMRADLLNEGKAFDIYSPDGSFETMRRTIGKKLRVRQLE